MTKKQQRVQLLEHAAGRGEEYIQDFVEYCQNQVGQSLERHEFDIAQGWQSGLQALLGEDDDDA